MKKKIFVIVLIFCIFLALGGRSYGFVKESGYNIKLVERSYAILGEKNEAYDEILSQLKNSFENFNDSYLRNEMIIETYIVIKQPDKDKKKFEVYFGESPKKVTNNGKSSFKIDDLKNMFGLVKNEKEENLYDGYKWNVNIIAKMQTGKTSGRDIYNVKLKALYAGEDINEVYDADVDDGNFEEKNKSVVDDGFELYDMIKSAQKWITNAGGGLVGLISAFFRTVGDISQYWANIVQTVADGNAMHMGVTYDYKDLKKDENEKYNRYIKVGDADDETAAIKTIELEKDENENGVDDFKKSTEIPYTIVDFYTIGMGNIDYFDINFLTGNKSTVYEIDENGEKVESARHSEKSIWMRFRNFVAAMVRLGIYATAVMLLTSLIWNGIKIVRHTLDNPQEQADSKQAIGRLANALFALIGTILVIALSIFANEGLLKLIGKEDTYELPIRVNVEDTYSFSTTLAGYTRYMSTTSDEDKVLQMFVNAVLYMVFALLNLIVSLFGIARVILVWILSIKGPIMSIRYIWGKQDEIGLRKWAKLYVIIVFIQIPIAFFGRLAIDIA